jgi:hypothetical protein
LKLAAAIARDQYELFMIGVLPHTSRFSTLRRRNTLDIIITINTKGRKTTENTRGKKTTENIDKKDLKTICFVHFNFKSVTVSSP